MSFVREIADFVVARGKYGLLPIVLMTFVPGRALAPTKGSAIAPFVDTPF